MATLAEPLAQRKATDWHLGGLLACGLGHGVNDFFAGTVAFTIFYVIAGSHLPPWYQGALAFVWYSLSSIVQPLVGAFTDRHGRWWFLPSAVLATVLALSFATLSPSIWVLAGLIVIAAVGSAVMHPVAGKYTALLSGSRKSQGMSIFQMGGSAGYSLGPITIAFLIAHFDRNGSLFMLIPGLIGAAFVFVAIKAADALARSEQSDRKQRETASEPVDRLGMALVVASVTVRFLVIVTFVTYLPNLLTGRGDSLLVAGQIVTLFLVLSNLGVWLGGYLGDRYGPIAVSVVAFILAVPCLLGFFFLPPALGIASLVLGQMFVSVQAAPGVVIAQQMMPKSLGMALGLINGVAFGAGSVLVTVVGMFVTRYGPDAAMRWVSFMPLVAALAFGLVALRLKSVRRPEAAPAS